MIVTGLMRYHIRCITQPPIDGQEPLAGGSSAAEGAASTPQASGRQREGETTSATNNTDGDSDSDGDSDGDPNGRGSKTQVLADLAKERDKRQAFEEENTALKARLAEFERAQMTEQEKTAADLKTAQDRVAALEAQIAEQQHQAAVAAALKTAGLPADLAGRLQGSTPEALAADAKALAAALGEPPVDPSQGQHAGGKPAPRSLTEALRNHYNIT
nr:MAG TPA: protein of unknown function (DUF4355) [Caudoviricetes sp.]